VIKIKLEVLFNYFAAANEGRIDDAVACFTPDAQVHDEARYHNGVGEIRTWIEDTRKYEPHIDVTGIETAGDVYVATGTVTGKFPGSPVQLQFSFTLVDGKIAHLVIK